MPDPFDQLRRYGRDLRDAVPPERARLRAAAVLSGEPAGSRRPRRAALALATAGLLALSNLGLAAVADGSVPGDPLYGVDRAYERIGRAVGFQGDEVTERIDEASVLAQRGRADEAVDLVRQALDRIEEAEDPIEAERRLHQVVEDPPVRAGLDEDWLEDLLEAAHSAGSNGTPENEEGGVADQARRRSESVRETIPPVAGTTPSGNVPGGPPDDPGSSGQSEPGGPPDSVPAGRGGPP